MLIIICNRHNKINSIVFFAENVWCLRIPLGRRFLFTQEKSWTSTGKMLASVCISLVQLLRRRLSTCAHHRRQRRACVYNGQGLFASGQFAHTGFLSRGECIYGRENRCVQLDQKQTVLVHYTHRLSSASYGVHKCTRAYDNNNGCSLCVAKIKRNT